MERAASDLGSVNEHIDVVAAGCHEFLEFGLFTVRFADALIGGDTVRAKEDPPEMITVCNSLPTSHDLQDVRSTYSP